MEEEIKELKRELNKGATETVGGYDFIKGEISGREIVAVQSGIGKVNAAVAAVLLIEKFGCTEILNTGSAGGVGHGLKVGDVVLSTELSYFDADATVFGYEKGQIPQMPARFMSSAELTDQTKAAAAKAGLTIQTGMIVSGDSFVSGGKTREEIIKNFPEAMVVEMEGAAVAQTCWRYSIPFLVVRAVSDTADQTAAISFDEFILEAGKKSARMVLEFLKG